MISNLKKIIVLAIFIVMLSGKSQQVKREGKDFHGYLPPEETKGQEYHVFQYPPNNYPFKEDYSECERNPMLPLLGKGLNLLLLKLGVFGIIKAITALILVALLAKLPLLLLKAAFLKSFFFPFLIAPLLMHMFMNQMTPSGEGGSEPDKPGNNPVSMSGMSGMSGMPEMPALNEMTMDMGRQLGDNLTSVAWRSMKMFVESGQCAEKISCMIGASSKDSAVGSTFSRILKYLHYSSPASLRTKVNQIREAFSKGIKTSTCSPEEFKCESPELLLQYGMQKVKIL